MKRAGGQVRDLVEQAGTAAVDGMYPTVATAPAALEGLDDLSASID